MGKTLEDLKADMQRAMNAYQEAIDSGEGKLNAIARQQDAGIRPEYRREDARDENGNPVRLDRNGNPEWRSGQRIEGARARPVYTPPLRSPYSEPSAPPPDIDFKGSGTWEETEKLWRDLVDVLCTIDEEKLTQEDRESCVQQIVPSLLDRLAQVAPRVDCAFTDGPMGKGAWAAMVAKYQLAFNPSKSLERSIGTMRTRTAPKFVGFAIEGAKWLFRKCPTGIPQIILKKPQVTPDENIVTESPVKKRGRPKKVADHNVSNLE